MSDEYVTTIQAGKILHVKGFTIAQWCNSKKIKFIKTLGGHRRIPLSEIDRLLEKEKNLGNQQIAEEARSLDKE